MSFEEGILSRLKDYREKLGLTQADLGERLGLHKNNVLRYENGQSKLTLPLLEEWAKALGIKVSDIVAPEGPVQIVQLPPSEEEIEKRVIETLAEWQAFRKQVIAKAAAIRKKKQSEGGGGGS